MAYDAWLEVPGLVEEGRAIRLPVEIGERHTGVDTWLASLHLVRTVEDFVEAADDLEDLKPEPVKKTRATLGLDQTSNAWWSSPKSKKAVGVGHSTQRPHEEYEEIRIPANLVGLLEDASHTLPPDWEPKVSWAEQNHIEGRVGFFPAPLIDNRSGTGLAIGNPYAIGRRRTQPLYMSESEQRKRQRRDPDDLDDMLDDFPDVEEEMDPTEAALQAETRNEIAPRADQQLANVLIGNHVLVVTGPLVNLRGRVTVWQRETDGEIWLDLSQCDSFGKIIPSAPMRVRMTDVELVEVDKLELEDPGYLEDEAAATMTEAEQDAAVYGFTGDEDKRLEDTYTDPWEDVEPKVINDVEIHDIAFSTSPAPYTDVEVVKYGQDVEAHGPAVSVTVTTPDGEQIGSWRTHEDGTHVPVGELACPECHIVHSAVRHCRNCNCIDAHACEGGCFWTDENECSNCSPRVKPEPEPMVYAPPEGYHDEIINGPPPPDHVNLPVEKTPEEVAVQKEKGTQKLIKEQEEREHWKKEYMPVFIDMVKQGYNPNTHPRFLNLREDLADVLWEALYKKKLATRN